MTTRPVKRWSAALVLLFCLGCAPEDGAPPEALASDEPRTLSDPAPDVDGVLRVLVYHDMEGLAGQDDFRSFLAPYPEYQGGRRLLTADVNAVIAGLFDGGAAEVHVVDAHGSTSTEPDLLLDELDARAEMVYRDRPFQAYMDLTEEGAYDAVAVVGMHAKTGSRGFASHTFTIGMAVILNGMSITETETIAFSWGRVGTPVIFASGDDRLGDDLKTMPWIEYVTTKTATSASTAELRPVDEVRAELRARAAVALRNRDRARAMTVNEPIDAVLTVVAPSRLDMLAGVPGVAYDDQSVRFVADDYADAIAGVSALMNVAQAGWTELMFDVARDGGLDDPQPAWLDAVVHRWLDAESGRWTPPAPAPARPGRRYHGAN